MPGRNPRHPTRSARIREAGTGSARKANSHRNFLAVLVSGPTRIGHYFNPVCATADGTRRYAKAEPVIVPGRAYDWRMVYDPKANDAAGAIEVTLGTESVTLNLKPGDKERGASFDSFGLFSSGPGGGLMKIYFDDLKYTAGR